MFVQRLKYFHKYLCMCKIFWFLFNYFLLGGEGGGYMTVRGASLQFTLIFASIKNSDRKLKYIIRNANDKYI